MALLVIFLPVQDPSGAAWEEAGRKLKEIRRLVP